MVTQLFYFLRYFIIITALILGMAPATVASGVANWEAQAGHDIVIDSSGWEFPVAIRFVSNPGESPNAPLYYVSELRGRIKVVTQNRDVHIYADNIADLRPQKELPDLKGEFGTTGLCLNESAGHLYVTTVYRKGGLLFNKIIRYASPGGKLGLTGTPDLEITDVFNSDRSSLSHQIGNCIIGSDQKLYVGVGDGHQHQKAQLLHHSPGKVMRMNLDGTATTDNPFYDAQDPKAIAGYVYSYGLRNPFALAEIDGVIYAAESGPRVDRLLRLTPGRNYLWDGTDASMLMNGVVTWPDPLGPAAMDYLWEHPLFPQWRSSLLISGSVKAFITRIEMDNALGAKTSPETVVRYIGSQETEKQYVVPVAMGPDGLYFSGFLPQADGNTHIMKMVPAGSQVVDATQKSGEAWYQDSGCAACHSIGGVGGTQAPALDHLVFRLEERLSSSEYAKQLERVDALTTSPFVDYREARDTLRNLTGKEQVAFWIEKRLQEPLFDSPDSQMPNFQLSPEAIEAITQYLMSLAPKDKYRDKPQLEQLADDLKFYLSTHLDVWLGTMFVLGILFGLFGRTIFRMLWRLKG